MSNILDFTWFAFTVGKESLQSSYDSDSGDSTESNFLRCKNGILVREKTYF